MSKKNILIFPCGSEIGLEIYNSVRYSTYFHLIGASSVDDHGKYVFEDYISGLPFVTDDAIFPALKKIVKERDIKAIYPTMDLVITRLKEHEEEIGCPIVSSSAKTTDICLSKEKTYGILKDYIRTPKVYSYASVDHFPVFVKPIVGYGSRGTHLVHNAEELKATAEGRKDVLIMEYLPGQEYTVDCFTNRKGKLLYSAARVRNRIKSGISVNTFFVKEQEEFSKKIEIINSRIRFDGAWFAQFKRDQNGNLCLMEIACRLGGASALSRVIGVNFAQLSLFDLFGYDVNISANDCNVVLDRALSNKYRYDINYDAVYVDYDDCLILDKKYVNRILVSFLYKCVNENKKIILLTKHDVELDGELRHFRIEGLFDEIIHICRNDNKAHYIMNKNSIFIDDSFTERENVRSSCHIPVFSPDMVEALI